MTHRCRRTASILDHFPVGNLQASASATWLPPIPFPCSSSGSAGLLKQPTNYLDSSACPPRLHLGPTKLRVSIFFITGTTISLPLSPTTISFTNVTPAATWANSESQKDIHLISSSTMNPFSLPRVATETALPEVVTFSLSASVSITSIRLWSTVISPSLPTTSMNGAGDILTHRQPRATSCQSRQKCALLPDYLWCTFLHADYSFCSIPSTGAPTLPESGDGCRMRSCWCSFPHSRLFLCCVGFTRPEKITG